MPLSAIGINAVTAGSALARATSRNGSGRLNAAQRDVEPERHLALAERVRLPFPETQLALVDLLGRSRGISRARSLRVRSRAA